MTDAESVTRTRAAFGDALSRGERVAVLPRYSTAELDLQAVYPSTRHIPARVRPFVECLAETFGDDPPWNRHVGAGNEAG